MNIYCKSCGAPNAYGSKKPKFCSNCGSSLDSTAKAKVVENPKPKKTVKPAEVQASYEEDDFEEEAVNIPNITKIEADIESSRQRGFKLGEIAGTATEGDQAYIRPDGPDISPEQALKDLASEGGSMRQKGNT